MKSLRLIRAAADADADSMGAQVRQGRALDSEQELRCDALGEASAISRTGEP